jgi:hypothetical protein
MIFNVDLLDKGHGHSSRSVQILCGLNQVRRG